MMFIPLLIVTALAATPDQLAQAWYLVQTDRLQQASAIAVAALNENPHDFQAHRLYFQIMEEALHEGGPLEFQYRNWVEREPDNLIARVSLAGIMSGVHKEPGDWCQEIQGLLSPLPEDTGIRFWALRYMYSAAEICHMDRADLRQELLDLAKVTPTALGFGLRLRMEEGHVDADLAADLRTFYTMEPWNVAYPGDLWRDGLKGPALKQARNDALSAAREALKSDQPACAYGAFQLFRLAQNDPGMVAAENRLSELDHQWYTSESGWKNEPGSHADYKERSHLEIDLEWARHKASPESAKEALAQLGTRIPPDGPLKAIWLKEMGFVFMREGLDGESFKTFKAAWQEDPSNPDIANAFAYTAALQGKELDLALVVMDSVLKDIAPYDAWNDHDDRAYDGWAESIRDDVAARLDTRAWILHQLGRSEEAAAVLQRALLLAFTPEPIIHQHLGLVLLALGREDAALEQLGRGLALGPSDEEQLDELAREQAESLFQDHRWSPGGFDCWLSSRLPPSAAPVDRSGDTIEDLSFIVDGKERHLSDFAAPRVLLLWSGKSRAFTQALPYWKEIAKKYRKTDVQMLAISVDDDPHRAEAFCSGYKLPPFLLGWAGPTALHELKTKDIPQMFVLDPQGVITGSFSGYIRADDHRIEEWVDAILLREPPL